VLKAVTSENPTMRYLAGWIEGKISISDEEFHKMVMQTVMSPLEA